MSRLMMKQLVGKFSWYCLLQGYLKSLWAGEDKGPTQTSNAISSDVQSQQTLTYTIGWAH